MRIAIGCDHAGFALKGPLAAALEADGHDVLDLGTFSTDPVDYPDFAKSVGQAVLRGFVEAGVLVCGSGVGASIAANKLRGVRAALCHDLFTARQSREDDDANLLCLGARVLEEGAAVEVTRAWLDARFTGEERHVRRVAKIAQLEGSPPAADRATPAPARMAPAGSPTAPASVPRVATPPATPAPPAQRPSSAPPAATPAAPSPAAARPTPAAAAARSAPAPPKTPTPPPGGPPTPPPAGEPRRLDPLAAQAEELFRQFAERHPDDAPPAKPEGVISLDDVEEARLEIDMPAPKARRPEPKGPAPKTQAPEPKAPAAKAPAEPKPRAAESRARVPESPAPAAPIKPAAPAPPKEPEPPPLPDAFRLPPVEEALGTLESEDFLGRIWVKDAQLWNGDMTEIRNRLGWLTSPTIMEQHAEDIKTFADEIRRLQFTHVVLLGMGGSSLASEVFSLTFASKMGFPDMLVLDSTDPGAVKRTLERINLQRSVFVVSTKSGTTVETLSFYAFFRAQVDANKPPKPGQQFIAITDPGTPLEKLAGDAAFRRTFLNPPSIGGRYSALSFVGLVPAALIGVDVRALLERAQAMVEACGHEVAVQDNPGVRLGAALAGFATSGRDKVTLVFSEKIRALGAWIEQLLAESLGKDGKGLVPVDGEPLGPPAVYGEDRVFVAVVLEGDRSHAGQLAKLAEAGHPVIHLTLKDPFDLGAEFFRWELATAAAGALLGVNPFDEPDVAAAKDKTAALLAAWKKSRRLPEWAVAAEEDGIALMTASNRGAATVSDGLAGHLALGQPGDYVALQAYLTPHGEAWNRLQEIRTLVRDRYRLATTVAYGPRYLHSTGQLHKGGPATGLFIQLTGDDPDDQAVPGAGYGFGTLKAAQALGDLEALSGAGRRVIRLHLRGKPLNTLDKLVKLVRTLVKKP